ncbi:hypothetical protein [Pelosinus sp. UFO1]|uniref:hypothetical protein n=1 Tax=Pelosinus sp. UFO1 TaxID=484770 RepID=UPI0004D1B2D7|nr:hypothetical protein [Pelosinus sp. UFO1]AIF49791.1 hypothetical protein UFO1_0230 [Pelosinus sp. UFO1]
MKELNSEDVKAYTDFEIIDLSKKKQIWSSFLFNLLIAIPTAFFGDYSDITRIVIPLIIIISAVWVVYLSFKIEKKRESFILYLGCNALFTSIICMLASYKILSTIIEVNNLVIVSVVALYIICLLLNVLNVLRLIRKGHYGKSSQKGSAALIIPFSVLGLGIGKAMVGRIGNSGAVILLASCLMIFSFMYLIGTQNILKYVLIQIYDKSTAK